ncbi:MAG: DUF2442 domain-containing protein [Pseudomonadota bacterium]
MRISQVKPLKDYFLLITTDDGRTGKFDLKPYLHYEAFETLNDVVEFNKIINGSYYVEWECGADLSADTIEAHLVQA